MMMSELREIPEWVKGQLPTQAMADLMRRHRQELNRSGEELAAARRRAGDLAEVFGLAMWKKRGGDPKQFRILWDALESAGVVFVDHVGEPVAGDLEEMADIVDWVDQAEGIEPGCVSEAFEPEILLDGVMVHRAKLIGVLDMISESETVVSNSETTVPSSTGVGKSGGSGGFNSKTRKRTQRKKQ